MPVPDKLYIQIILRRDLDNHMTVQEMREIPGSATTRLQEFEERMVVIHVPRLQDPQQFKKYTDTVMKAVKKAYKRQLKQVVKAVYCEPFMDTRESDGAMVRALVNTKGSRS